MITSDTLNTMTPPTRATFSPPATLQRSPWHSPVPYLFGGLAAMLGLIAFALLILACSYWKLSGQFERENSNGEERERDLEAGDEDKPKDNFPVFEERILVIMAGDVKPTFLATPLSSKGISFRDGKGKSENEERERDGEESEKPKQDMGDHETKTTNTAIIDGRESQETRENQ
ncbi:Protein GLUTAMINE DUMPER like [Actinidia chinensis var. chinensis]|uniref:Protein GLUTAMINE DUMPER like n=1 Tax=Actinidia chinensis var. chinensis TaxID=1590841 RepID=A0A2R6Q2F3_ACTCC|nr:Protein GLUTAMINE DUMPER like [Actinidia chinensis var. chinensis]